MYEINHKTLHELTVEDVDTAARENAEHYIDRAKNIAHQAFVEGVLWAQKYQKEGQTC